MSEIQDQIDKQMNKYSDGCVCYKDEETRSEICGDCPTYCEDYLEQLDLDDLEEMLKSEREHYKDSRVFFTKFPKDRSNSQARIRGLVQAIASKGR